MRKFRTTMIGLAIAGATVAGAAVAQASPSPADGAMPASPEECLAHHPEWSGADAEVMWGLMESHDPGEMAAFHGGSMGDMASMMGGGMGHMGLSR